MKGARTAPRERKNHPVRSGILLLLASMILALIPLWFASIEKRDELFASYFQNPYILALNVLPVLVLTFLLYVISNRTWLAGLVSGVLFTAIAFVNRYKLTFRSEPLNFEDITLFREAGAMTGKGYTLFLDQDMILALVIVLVLVLLLKLFAGGRLQKRARLIWLVGLLGSAGVLFVLCRDDSIYGEKTRNITHINQWAENEVYYSKGLVYPFLHSTATFSVPKLKGYSEQYAKELLGSYEDESIPEDQRIDVMTIMLEAYADFEEMGVEGIAPSVYAPLRKIQKESVHGNLITNIYAGGTVNTERAFLSGMVRLPTFRGATNAYPWYFKENGYHTEGAHAGEEWFYNRGNINKNMGFDDYFFLDGDVVGENRLDESFFPVMEERYRDYCKENTAPYFAYHLTYQGHGPYSEEELYWGERLFRGSDLDEGERTILDNYLGSIRDSMNYMNRMLQSLKTFDRPLVVVAFGDHKPWMGDSSKVLTSLGINMDLGTEEGVRNLYSTPYFIWANDKAKEILGNDFSGEGEELAPSFLMNKLFELCGFKGPAYMQATTELMKEVPVPTDLGVYFMPDGSMTAEEPEAAYSLFELQYYYQKTFLYETLRE